MNTDQIPTVLYLVITEEAINFYFLKQRSSWFSRTPKNYTVCAHKTIALPDTTIHNGTLNNPSMVETLVRKTLATHAIKEIETILIVPCVPGAPASPHQNLQTFSYLVCLSNAGCMITNCYAQPMGAFPINNNPSGTLMATSPDLFLIYQQPAFKKLMPWLGSTFGAGLMLCLIALFQSNSIERHVQLLTGQKNVLEQTRQTLHTACAAQTQLNTQTSGSSSKSYKDLLISLGDLLPDHTWIEHLELTPTHKTGKEREGNAHITLEGITHALPELSTFLAKMKKSPTFNGIQLLHMKKESTQAIPHGARFKLAGIIPWYI